MGAAALLLNTTGARNTATGTDALVYNDTGGFNTANGAFALFSNTAGMFNTASGQEALTSNTTGSGNMAIGESALNHNIDGANNTAIGASGALSNNTSGNSNTAVGAAALGNNTVGTGNVTLGNDAGSNVGTANNVICIGAEVSGEDVSNSTWIGNVYGVTTQSGSTLSVVVSDTGQLGTMASSERFKKNITTMENASRAILSLRPVTFRYKNDTTETPQFGLVAEEVEKVDPDLIARDEQGKPYSVRYEAVNAMLLNEFLKEHRKGEEQRKLRLSDRSFRR